MRSLLRSCLVEPVFTAHPTEARRRSVLFKLRRLSDIVEQLDDPRLTSHERLRLFDRIREEVTSLWLTEEVRGRAPRVLDEGETRLALLLAQDVAEEPAQRVDVGAQGIGLGLAGRHEQDSSRLTGAPRSRSLPG